jgi:predicted transposase YdaD
MSTTLGQTLEEWAEQRGIERGIERGRLETARQMLCWLLEDRFGPLPDDLRLQIDEIKDLARLERAIRRCPNLSSLEDLQLPSER